MGANLGGDGLGSVAVVPGVDRNVGALSGERESDGATDVVVAVCHQDGTTVHIAQ